MLIGYRLSTQTIEGAPKSRVWRRRNEKVIHITCKAHWIKGNLEAQHPELFDEV